MERRKRDPVNESRVQLTPDQIEVARLAAKFVPTDRRPVDMGDVNGGFEQFANTMRWTWYHEKKDGQEDESESEDLDQEAFVMVPWYKRSSRRAPKGNAQLEAGLDKMRAFLNNPANKRRVRDNMTPSQRLAMRELRDLPHTSGAQVVFEDKGNRFVVRDLDEQDNQLLEKLQDRDKFDELDADPTERVKDRLGDFCTRWKDELNAFHPNIVNFITDLDDTHPSKVKGLIKCHKPPRPGGQHGIRLLLASCGTPTQPASKFLQMSIAHLFKHLPHKLKNTQALLGKIIDINESHPEGLPDQAINLGCDVVNMFGSIDQEYGLQALEERLARHPNPDGLPPALILDLARICLQENSCEFLGRFFCPNSGTATGPPHACEFCDVAMAPLDDKMEAELERMGISNTGWKIFRDDGYLMLLGGMGDLAVVRQILNDLHPAIKWECNPRGPTAPALIGADGVAINTNILEHLDLAIHLIDGKLETDVHQKDIPIYISTRSCHPPATFTSVAKSVAMRLVMNCSLERFLSPRIEEYTRYLMASGYSRKEVEKEMEEARQVDRVELIRRPPRARASGRKFAMVSRWDPRGPNIKEGLKQLESILYENPENLRIFPRGSIIPAFRRGRNLGEIIAPTKPLRERPERVEGGSFACDSRRCLLHQSGALQLVDTITSRADGQTYRLPKRTTCTTRYVIYHILCPCAHPKDYVGSTQDPKVRWSHHKSHCRVGNWGNCGLTEHMGQHHQDDMEGAIANLKVTLLDHLAGNYREERLLQLEKDWIIKLGTFGPTGLNTRNQLLSQQRRNWGPGH